MRKYLALLLLAVPACGPSTNRPPEPLPMVQQKPAAIAKPVTPALGEATVADNAANIQAAAIAAKLQASRQQLADTRTNLQEANTQITELRKEQTVTSKQWDELTRTITDTDTRLKEVEAEHESTLTDLANEKLNRKVVSDKLQEATNLASAKESEASQLRDQLETEQEQSTELYKKAAELSKANNENADKAARSDGIIATKSKTIVRLWITVAVLVAGCLVLAKFALRL